MQRRLLKRYSDLIVKHGSGLPRNPGRPLIACSLPCRKPSPRPVKRFRSATKRDFIYEKASATLTDSNPISQSEQSRLELGCVATVDDDGRTIWILVRCLCRLRSRCCRLTIHKAFFDIAYLVSDAITGKALNRG